MTVAWDDVEAALEAFVVASLAASSKTCGVVWRDKSSKSHVMTPYVELSIGGEMQRGHDEVTWSETGTAPDNVLVPTVKGDREFILQVRVRSRSQTADKAARNYAEVIRASLYHPYLRQPLDVAGVAFLSVSGVGSAATRYEGVYESVFVLDVRFATKSELYLPAQSGAPVEHVEITPTLDDVEYPLIEIP